MSTGIAIVKRLQKHGYDLVRNKVTEEETVVHMKHHGNGDEITVHSDGEITDGWK